MATPGEKLAESLETLYSLQNERGGEAIKTGEISRIHRQRLVKNGFLKEVTKGWYIVTDPKERVGDSTSWYTSYWKFCARYLEDKYQKQYIISPEQSLLIHSGNQNIPKKLIVRAPGAPNKSIEFLYGTSILELKSTLPNPEERVGFMGIQMFNLPSALIRSSPTIFEKNPMDVRPALAQITDASEVLKLLLDGSHSVIAGRLAGAFRNNGQGRIADEIVKTMKSADYDVRENDPFQNKPQTGLSFREKSPYSNRIRLLWENYRTEVIKHFPESPGIPENKEAYLKAVDDIYVTDAYHSLSIEYYKVSKKLIEKVRSGDWDIMGNKEDEDHRAAMAARGYWQAVQVVRKSIEKILEGDNAGKVGNHDHSDWYRELFTPSVTAGLLKPADLAGYRTNQVYIGQSMHVPMNKDAVRDAMPVLFELLEKEVHAGVRAVLGHFVFVNIHPYMDGNGRMGRFLMNVMLASGGYPWTVIPVEERDRYMNALEMASIEKDIRPFTIFISDLVNASLNGMPVAEV